MGEKIQGIFESFFRYFSGFMSEILLPMLTHTIYRWENITPLRVLFCNVAPPGRHRVGREACASVAPLEPYKMVSHHTAQASGRFCFTKTQQLNC